MKDAPVKNNSERSANDEPISSFSEFWPFYVREHSNKLNRRLHLLGTTIAYSLGIFVISRGLYIWLPACIACGYLFSWYGHFVVQKNRPATFKYPVWSFMGDHKMIYLTLTGRFGPEIVQAFKE